MNDRFTIVPLLQSPDKPDRVEKQCPKKDAGNWQLHEKPCKQVRTPDPETRIKQAILAAAKLPQLQKGETGPASDDNFFLSIGEVEADFDQLHTDLAKWDTQDKFGFQQAADPTALYARIRTFVAGKVFTSAYAANESVPIDDLLSTARSFVAFLELLGQKG